MTNPVNPTPIQALPPAPLVTDTPEQFDDKAFPFAEALEGMRDGMNSAASVTYQNAVAADERAQIAEASASVASSAATRAESARDRAVQAEQAIDQALVEGPVLSVQGKTGIVDITAELQATALLF